MPPKLQSIENRVKVENERDFELNLSKLELNMLMFHYFNEVDTLKRTVLVAACFIVLGDWHKRNNCALVSSTEEAQERDDYIHHALDNLTLPPG